MADLIFAARRALFAQPAGMVAAMVRRKLGRLLGLPAPAAAAAASVRHPIDLAYGIDTGGVIPASALKTGSAADIYNFGYAGSQPSIVRAALRAVPGLESASFVDIGCGKGRVLAVASEFAFQRIVGVELSPALAAVARRNADVIAAAHPERTRIEVIEADALTVALPAGPLVAYIYNALYAPLVKRLAAAIAAHQAQTGSPVFLIYYNPASAPVFDKHPGFSRFYARAHVCDDAEALSTAWGTRSDSVVIWQGTGHPPVAPHPGAGARVAITAAGAAGQVEAADSA